MLYKKQLMVLSIVSIAVISIIGTIMPVHATLPLHISSGRLKKAINRQEERNEHTKFEAIIDALGITAGMTILDIGSGAGYASFLLAEKLHGTGEVFATDTCEDLIKHIADGAKKRGLTNLFPVVVTADGVDEFYGKHRYDLVFLANVYHCITKRIDYFTKLRKFLKPDARLVLLIYNQVPLFTLDDISDIDAFVNSLSKDTSDSPFVKHLSPTTRQLLKDKSRSDALESALVDDLNRMLLDPQFYKGFYEYVYYREGLLITPTERSFANWLIMTLNEDGVLDRPADQIDAKTMRAVIKLNRLFIIKRFGDFLENDGMGAYIPKRDPNRHTSKFVMLRELDAAGYKFSKEIKVSPYYDAVIMVPKTTPTP